MIPCCTRRVCHKYVYAVWLIASANAQITLPLSLFHTHTLSLSLSLSFSFPLSLSLSLSLTHTHTHTVAHTHTQCQSPATSLCRWTTTWGACRCISQRRRFSFARMPWKQLCRSARASTVRSRPLACPFDNSHETHTCVSLTAHVDACMLVRVCVCVCECV